MLGIVCVSALKHILLMTDCWLALIRAVAQDLELPLHEIDTFTRWQVRGSDDLDNSILNQPSLQPG
jgi:hypothetical protein